MQTVKMKLADKNILALVNFESTAKFCNEYITKFDVPDISVLVTVDDINFERAKADSQAELDNVSKVSFSDGYLETLALYRKIAEKMIDFGVILFHASAIAIDGEAVLFTASSGTGKSTHSRLWRECFGERVKMINDDKPLIAISEEGATVYGTPWNGKHRLGENMKAPLLAICIIERAKENKIKEVNASSEFARILSQTYRMNNADFMKKTLEKLTLLLKNVKVYKLGCNVEPEAASVAYNGMKGEKNEA